VSRLAARGILEDSTLRKNHFSFAITGLNLTYVLFDLTVKHRLNALFYALGPNMGAFQRVYGACACARARLAFVSACACGL
jgi:hypothetical protein